MIPRGGLVVVRDGRSGKWRAALEKDWDWAWGDEVEGGVRGVRGLSAGGREGDLLLREGEGAEPMEGEVAEVAVRRTGGALEGIWTRRGRCDAAG